MYDEYENFSAEKTKLEIIRFLMPHYDGDPNNIITSAKVIYEWICPSEPVMNETAEGY